MRGSRADPYGMKGASPVENGNFEQSNGAYEALKGTDDVHDTPYRRIL